MGKTRSHQLIVSLVAGACVLILAIASKYFVARELDFVSQYGPVWILIAYDISSSEVKRTRRGTLYWSLAIAVATLAIVVVYAL